MNAIYLNKIGQSKDFMKTLLAWRYFSLNWVMALSYVTYSDRRQRKPYVLLMLNDWHLLWLCHCWKVIEMWRYMEDFSAFSNPGHPLCTVDYSLILCWWFNVAWIMDTVDHHFVANLTKFGTEMVVSRSVVHAPTIEHAEYRMIIITIIYVTDTKRLR